MTLIKNYSAGYIYVTPDDVPDPWDTITEGNSGKLAELKSLISFSLLAGRAYSCTKHLNYINVLTFYCIVSIISLFLYNFNFLYNLFVSFFLNNTSLRVLINSY